MRWHWKKFENLSATELYEIIHLREQVFVVEQNCAYLDCDGHDTQAWHLSGYIGSELAAYLRVLPPGIKYDELSLGRVVTAPETRNCGHGKSLMSEALTNISSTFGPAPIRISAQAHLEKFYRDFGFFAQGAGYLEDGIAHIEMLRD